jgi:glycosyltransferase involved in cell wall biosynthesis
MRIAFCWDWEPSYQLANDLDDGLAAALRELEKRGHHVSRFTCGEYKVVNNIVFTKDMVSAVKADNPDVILHWADLTRRNAKPLAELGIPMALCFAAGDVKGDNSGLFDHIFVESEIYKQRFEEIGENVSTAFGTNTTLFSPIQQAKIFDTIYPSTFAEWKRHALYAEATKGLRSLAVGGQHEQPCWDVCVENDITVIPHVSAETLRYLYAASKVCVVTSSSADGSQRIVLEAMSMDMPVVITDSDKFDFARGHVFESSADPHDIRVMVNLALDSEVNTRDYVVKNWSEFSYADSLEAGLEKICR